MLEDIKRLVEEPIKTIIKDGVNSSNLDYLYKLVDVHKDIANEEYWLAKEENLMRYGYYGHDYGRSSRASRGRYMGHRPEDRLDEMYMNYQAYTEGKEDYKKENSYRSKEATMECLEYMLESMDDFVKMLKEEAGSQEEMDLIHKYIDKISE